MRLHNPPPARRQCSLGLATTGLARGEAQVRCGGWCPADLRGTRSQFWERSDASRRGGPCPRARPSDGAARESRISHPRLPDIGVGVSGPPPLFHACPERGEGLTVFITFNVRVEQSRVVTAPQLHYICYFCCVWLVIRVGTELQQDSIT